jgi:hypothetical protein
MKTYLVILTVFLSFFHEAFSVGTFYNQHSGYCIDTDHNPYKDPIHVQSHLMCLSYCNRESRCQTAQFNDQKKKCLLYDCKFNTNNLVSQSSSVVFVAKGNSAKYKETVAFNYFLFIH